jgi:type IV pilus assembly protein PilN
MLRINLLPVKKIKQRAEARRQLKFFGISFAALLAVLVFVILYLTGQVNGLNAEIATLDQKKTKLAEISKQIEELKKNKEMIEKQTELVKQLKKNSALTAHVLNEVANLTPNERMWLTALDQSGSTMKLTGTALDNQTVAEYLKKLEDSQYISSVSLTSSSLAKYAGRNLKNFVLSCTVAMPDAQKETMASEVPPGAGATESKK